MIEIDNRTSYDVKTSLLQTIANLYTKKDIELIITDDSEMRVINKEQRGIDTSTDVLSFPYDSLPFSPLGSIIISIDFVTLKSKELGHTMQEEFTLLFIHGLLHLLGLDHEVDKGEMRQEEKKLIEKFKLPLSLIVRTIG
jgi:probable rRNA maturation factor